MIPDRLEALAGVSIRVLDSELPAISGFGSRTLSAVSVSSGLENSPEAVDKSRARRGPSGREVERLLCWGHR